MSMNTTKERKQQFFYSNTPRIHFSYLNCVITLTKLDQVAQGKLAYINAHTLLNVASRCIVIVVNMELTGGIRTLLSPGNGCLFWGISCDKVRSLSSQSPAL